MFLWVCGEEQGLLGSAAYIAEPLVPLAKTAAALNLDSLNFAGVTSDVALPGAERTTLKAAGKIVAASLGLTVAEPRPDLAGGYFRSDHFSFAKAGVPAFSVGGGAAFARDGEPAKARADAYRKQRYHQVTDEFEPTWDFAAMAQQARFPLALGLQHANAAATPPRGPEGSGPPWDFAALGRQARLPLALGFPLATAAAMPAWMPGQAFAAARPAKGMAAAQ